jgi:putative thioredoxin
VNKMETIIGGPGQPGQGADVIKDVTTKTFMAEVIDASMEVPIIVDFWAPWCGPCKQLGPLLEKVVREAKGKVRMVKVDIDQNQALAQQLRIQSIPAVFAFAGGRPVDAFQGALPESQLKEFVKRLIGDTGPTPAENLLAEAQAAFEAGDLATAAAMFGEVIAAEPGNPQALAGLAHCYISAGDLARAKETLALVPPEHNKHSDVVGARASLLLAEETKDVGDTQGLAAKLVANPDDHQARFDLAMALFQARDQAAAVENLLDIVRRDRTWNDDGARKQLLKLFDAMGGADPLTISARKRLSVLLFS